jgi:SAM-dependent methyltransferase
MQVSAAFGNEQVKLQEADLRAPETTCPVCGSDIPVRISRLQEYPDVWLMHCSECQVSFVDRFPTEVALQNYYSRYYDKPKFGQMQEKVHFHMPNRLASHIFQVLQVSAEKPAILDFGGGDGTVAMLLGEMLIRQGAEAVSIMVVDHVEQCVEPSLPSISIQYTTDLMSVKPSSYDVVIASASLEHVPDPVSIMNQLFEALRSEGWFYARTPYVIPLMRLTRLLGIDMHFGYPAHLYDMGQGFWDSILHTLHLESELKLEKSQPSLVETTLASNFGRTIAAYTLKAPWRLFGQRWKLVGGWEVFLCKTK